jgi:transcriptional regulator with XRE-family HTH domain
MDQCREIIAERIKRLRKARKITSTELAERIGLSRTAISQIERKKSAPSVEVLCKIAQVLDCTPDYLLGFTDEPRPKVPVEHLWPEGAWLIRKAAELLDSTGREMLYALIETFLKQITRRREL